MISKMPATLNKVYSSFLDLMFFPKDPIDQLDKYVARDVMGYGTALDEKIFGLQDLKKLAALQRSQADVLKLKFKTNIVFQKSIDEGASTIIADEIAITISVEGNENVLNLRMSTIWECTEAGWMLVHWHGSKPEYDSGGEDTWHSGEWQKKNEELQKQVRKKTIELQKQNRELEIEAALERVRSRSMAMQKSHELAGLSMELVKQVQALGINTWFCAFNIYDEDGKGSLEWGSNGQGTFPEYRTPREGVFLKYYEAGQKGEELLINEIGEEECPRHYEYLCSLPGVGEQLLKMKAEGIAFPSAQIDHVAFFKYGYVIFITFDEVPEAHHIFKRFAKAFEQTYTRFLDLKNAEAQAREAQIEASLEKVRSVALSLKHSDEILQVARVLYEQLLELGFSNIRNAIIDSKNGDTDTFTDYDYSREMSGTITQMSYHDDPTLEGQFKMMATTTDDFFELILEGKELEDLKKMRISNGEAPDPRLENIDLLTYNLYSFGNGAIGISNFGVLSAEEKSVLSRFRNVFTFAYKRYIDMVQAEKQAREIQLELSLERIRAQVTAMQESSDLFDIVVNMRREFLKLGHEADYFWHMRWLADSYEMSMTSEDGSRIGTVITIPKYVHDNIPQLAEWEEGDSPVYVLPLDADGAWDYIENMNTHGRYEKVDPNAPTREDIQYIGGLTFIMARTTHGEIGFGLPGCVANPPQDSLDTLVRFAGVFDLAYRRFEDLKSAELQNRETQLELALERIRSKVTAMQESVELLDIVVAMRTEFVSLGHEAHYFWYMRYTAETYEKAMTSGDGNRIGMVMTLPRHIHGDIKRVADWEQSDEPTFVFSMDAETAVDYVHKMITLGDFKQLDPNAPTLDGIRDLGGLTFVMARSQYGEIGFSLPGNVPDPPRESLDTLNRFAGVFDLAYRRFKDLKKAEERTNEALKQASLDRIRGQVASMRNASDLQGVMPLIWNELKRLGVPFFRCGIFIVNEKLEHVQVYLTTPEGKALASLNLSFELTDLTRDAVKSWREKEVFRQHWNRDEFISWTKQMMELRQVDKPEEYQGFIKPPASLHLHFIPFAQGMLYVGNEEPLEKEKIGLVKSLAEAFSFAYARYEDFVVLEEAKERVENTLNDLKATQTQLVHAEKMASLGELTAGIAHEIQNPLNFVNNFSEVSADLIQELKEELNNGDMEEVHAIAADLLQNLEKIYHHGSRASGIVKSMLEHSRAGSGGKQLTDIKPLANEYLRLAYHGLRAQDKSFNADFRLIADENLPKINIVPQDVGRVLLNLINNAFHAVQQRNLTGLPGRENYKPEVVVTLSVASLHGQARGVKISIKDNGPGIPDKIKDKIFQPFFTTKPTGQGTGLGLSLSYDIITKGHGGELTFETEKNKGTEFIIIFPI